MKIFHGNRISFFEGYEYDPERGEYTLVLANVEKLGLQKLTFKIKKK